MPYDDIQIIATALVLFLGGLLQSAVGFAYGLFAIPLLVWIDIPIEQVIAVILVSSCLQGLLAAHALREHIPWSYVYMPAIIRILFLIVGVALLKVIVDLDKEFMQALIGGVLIASVLLMWSLPERKSQRVHKPSLYVASAASGVVGGLIGMGGPPLLIWALLQPWEQKQLRSFMFCIFVATLPVQMVLLIIMFGWAVCWGALLGILMSPFIISGSRIGVHLGNYLTKQQLHLIAYVILLILGLKSIYNYFS